MKLAGPRLSIRYVLHLDRLQVIVGGVFPPEDRPLVQQAVEELTRQHGIEGQMRQAWERSQREHINRLLYGDPDAPEPRGIMHP